MPAATGPDVRRALRRAAAVGPFFALDAADTGDTAEPGAPQRWEPQSARVAVAALGVASRAPHPRIAASLLTMSLAARALSPAVAVALLDGVVLDVRSARWRYDAGIGARLRLDAPSGWHADPAAARPDGGTPRRPVADEFADVVLPGVEAAVLSPVRAAVPVSPRALWGNVASSLAGALQSLAASGAVPPGECRAFGDAVLGHPLLAGAGGFAGSGLAFRRRSCCLFYKLPAGGLCGDCVLRRQ